MTSKILFRRGDITSLQNGYEDNSWDVGELILNTGGQKTPLMKTQTGVIHSLVQEIQHDGYDSGLSIDKIIDTYGSTAVNRGYKIKTIPTITSNLFYQYPYNWNGHLLDVTGDLIADSYITMTYGSSPNSLSVVLWVEKSAQSSIVKENIPHYISIVNTNIHPMEVAIVRQDIPVYNLTDKNWQYNGGLTGNTVVIEPDTIVEFSFIIATFNIEYNLEQVMLLTHS